MSGQAGFWKRLGQGLLIGLVGASLALTAWHLGWLESWEAKTWDWRASLLAKPGKATDKIILIMLDQNSLDWAKEENGLAWPWPREVYSAIVGYCKRNGAKALAFDVLFSEHSKYGVADDALLGEAIAAYGRFAAAIFLGDRSGAETNWPPGVAPSKLKLIAMDRLAGKDDLSAFTFARATFPVPAVANNAAVLCNVHLNPDRDGIYRRVKLFSRFDDGIVASLGLGAYLAANPEATLGIERRNLKIGNSRVPIDRNFNAVLRYRGPAGTHKTYSAAAVIQSEIRVLMGETPTIKDSKAFRDKYVLFGFSAPGLYDLRSAPVGGVYPGVEIQATMLDNFISGDFIQPISSVWTHILVLFAALACAVLIIFFSKPMQSVAVAVGFVSIPVFMALMSYIQGFWLDLLVLETALIASILMALVFNYTTEGRQKRFIKGAFKQYLSPAVIDQLIQHPERLKLGGERRTLSIFFSDLQGFTSISEGLAPEELTALLNDYLSEMTEIIQNEGGTVDKYEGDAIIAFWNAPLEVPEHALKAVRAALGCQTRLAELRPVFRERIGKDMYMRIGLNTGPAVVGNLGSHTRFDYTMLGDSVNLAARLEGANKAFGTYTMISDSTHAITGDAFAFRELARLAVVGRKEPVTVYEPMPKDEYTGRQAVLEIFNSGLDKFYKGEFEQAIETLAEISDVDPAAAAYVAKCRQFLGERPDNWQGVWVMTSK